MDAADVRIVAAAILAALVGMVGGLISLLVIAPMSLESEGGAGEGGGPAGLVLVVGLIGTLAVAGHLFSRTARCRYVVGVAGALASWIGLSCVWALLASA